MNSVLPYRVASRNRVVLGEFECRFGPNGTAKAKPQTHLKAWDASEDVRLVADVRIDVPGLREDAGLPNAPLRVAAWWTCKEAVSMGRGSVIALGAEAFLGEVEVRLSGREVKVAVEVSVAVVVPVTLPRSPITAWRAGSVLWEQRKVFELGSERFPVVVMDFRVAGGVFSADALWQLEWLDEAEELAGYTGLPQDMAANSTPDRATSSTVSGLSRPLRNVVTFYVNSGHAGHRHLLGPVLNAEMRLRRAVVEQDVGRLLVQRGLHNLTELLSRPSWPNGSVGQCLERLLAQVFHGVPRLEWPGMAALLAGAPEQFEARFQAGRRTASELFGGDP